MNVITAVHDVIVIIDHEVQAVHILVVVLLLERDVDDGLGDGVTHLLETLGLFDEDLEIIAEVHGIALLLFELFQDVLFQIE